MKKLDKLSKLLNLILGFLYIPLSLFSWLLQMASESAMEATNPLYINLISIVCVVAFLIPFLCIVGTLVAIFLRRKRHYILSIVFQLMPLTVFLLNLALLACTDLIPMVV